MDSSPTPPVTSAADLAGIDEPVRAQVDAWLERSARHRPDVAARRLADVLADPHGLGFVVGFVDGVVRPEDPRVAAQSLRELTHELPDFLPPHLRAAVRAGAVASRVAPGTVVRVARRVLRAMVGHLVVDADEDRLGRALARLVREGDRLNLNLLGEAVLGQQEAARRLEAVTRLVRRPDVRHVSVKVSAVCGPHSGWGHEETVAEVVEALEPLYRLAAQSQPPTFVNLDMEEYRDLDLTLDVFTTLLDRPGLEDLEAGVVLQAYLPDSWEALVRLQEWARGRRRARGARVRVRIVKGANLPMERVDAEVHGWPLATWRSKVETDAHYKRLLERALRPEQTEALEVGVAGHNLFDLAFAWELAGRRGVREHVVVEMLLGMAQAQAAAVRETVGPLVVYTPVVDPEQFDVAIAYLVRRLEEGASRENFMSALPHLAQDPSLVEREHERFLEALRRVDEPVVRSYRAARQPEPPSHDEGFENAPDTDPSVAAARAWGREVLERARTSELGRDTADAARVPDREHLEDLLTCSADAGRAWGARTAHERAEVLEAVADELERRRGELTEVMASECGKTLDQSDPEVSEAVDFARFYAASARAWQEVDGAVPVPVGVTLVAPPWNFPVAIPAGCTLAALASGSAVVLKPSHLARRCGAVLAEALWAAGVPREVLTLAQTDEGDVGRALVSDRRVGRVLLTGAYETAELFGSFRGDLGLLAETSGKNAIVVTPHADLDLAVKDVVSSAFGHAGQKCSAASLVILVGSVGRSRRFLGQLVDAVGSLRVGEAWEGPTQMGPLVAPAEGKLLDAFTRLGAGERWLVEPRRLDDAGRRWTPGVKDGVRRGSSFHHVECFGPVLGVMRADTLDEALAIQNEVAYGLTAGLHSLDPDEVRRWLAGVRAGNLYVNRHTTGAVVRRQPFGGWKRSAVGPGFKAGGRNHLVGLWDWRSRPARVGDDAGELGKRALDAAHGLDLASDDVDRLRRALRSDAHVWRHELSALSDPSALASEVNAFRHLPVTTSVRVGRGATSYQVLRTVAAGLRAGASLDVSFGEPPDEGLRVALASLGVEVDVRPVAAYADRLRARGVLRVRHVGSDPGEFLSSLGPRADLAVHDRAVVEGGRVELLNYLLEQAISVTAHRFGTPSDLPGVLGEVDRRPEPGVGPVAHPTSAPGPVTAASPTGPWNGPT